MPPTVEELLEAGATEIRRSPHIDHWQKGAERIDAEVFLNQLVDISDGEAEVPAGAERRFREMVNRRTSGEPAARILGFVDFAGLEIRVRDGAFFPRISSELLASEAIRRIRRRRTPVHVDLATGVGPVALAVAMAVPGARVVGVDLFVAAVKAARANARRLLIRNASFAVGDLFAPVPRRLRAAVDAVTIHPPYVGRDEVRDQPVEVVDFEPVETLTDFSPDGLGLVRRVLEESPGWLVPSGWLLIEVGTEMGRGVGALMRRAGYRDVSMKRDPYGVTRVIAGRRPR